MSFVWASKKPNEGVATLYESNITLNKSASTHFDHAYNVLLGIDYERKRIAVKPISKQEYERGAIPEEKRHKITVRPSYARVCNKKFMKEVAELASLDLNDNQAYKFKTIWSKADQALIIDLTQPEEVL
ncbi:MAG: hypothetical protein ACNA7U_04955 [Candidatus Izemoplasmataceae bacterium]|jgi:hypothetical protein|uniref:hypothetical protein n=1 Tax=Liberiplasma polymorphum TaxID=3374570 RepID=UPI0037741EB2